MGVRDTEAQAIFIYISDLILLKKVAPKDKLDFKEPATVGVSQRTRSSTGLSNVSLLLEGQHGL